MVVLVLSEPRSFRPSADVRSLSQRHDAERLRLALAGARAATFDWTIADDHVVWDGATEILSMHPDADRLQKGEVFRAWMNPEGRQKLATVIETASSGRRHLRTRIRSRLRDGLGVVRDARRARCRCRTGAPNG